MNVKRSKFALRLLTSFKQRQFCQATNAPNESNHYDIIVAGGGMIGTTLACTLGKNTKLSNKRILLLEGAKSFQPHSLDAYSNRVSALNGSTFTLLNSIGAWKSIEKARYATVKKLQVWDGISNVAISFNDAEFSETIAYIVENNLLVESVVRELEALPNVKIITGARIKTCSIHDVNNIVLDNDTKFTCSLLLGCDGANSQVRKCMGVQNLAWNYDQKGVVATVRLSEPTNNIVAWQRFLPTGSVALLPLTDSLSSLVWVTTSEEANRLVQLEPKQFVEALNAAYWKEHPKGYFIEQFTDSLDRFLHSMQLPSTQNRQFPPSIIDVEAGSRAAFPLSFGHATNYVGKGVALVGDAAHRVHPLAGQGVNLGFGDIVTLNRLLGDAVYSGCTLNSTNALTQYETERQRHNVPTMLAIDGLQRLYNTDWAPVVFVRSLGLQLTNALNPLKKAIIAHAGQ